MRGEIKAYIAIGIGFAAEIADDNFHFLSRGANIFLAILTFGGLLYLLVKSAIREVLKEETLSNRS